MAVSQRRNPFKRSATKGANSGNNALRHLTGKIVGFKGNENPNVSGIEPIDSNKDSEDIENVEVNTNLEVNVSFLFFIFASYLIRKN